MKNVVFVCIAFLFGFNTLHSQLAWPDIENRLLDLNAKYPYSQIDIKNIPDLEKGKFMMMTPEEFEIAFAEIEVRQQVDNERVEQWNLAQKQKAEYFAEHINPQLIAAKSVEEFHRLVLVHRQYCSATMVETAEAWLAAHSDPE